MNEVKIGFLVGTGAAQSLSLGFIPEYFQLTNLTDGDIINAGALRQVVPFSSGGTNEITAGVLLRGATSGATFRVKQVLLASGTWAAGTAAGFLIVEDITGTIGSENVYIHPSSNSSTDDATVTVNVSMGVATAAAVTSVASGSGFTPYYGSLTASQGVTIAAGVLEAGKLFQYVAMRSGAGAGN